MKSHPFHNVHDVKELAEKAFAEVPEDFVWNCYSHVEKQEDYYRKLLQLAPIPAENIDSWEISNDVETTEDYLDESNEHFLQDLLQSTNGDESESFSQEIPITVNLEPQETATFDCSFCDYKCSSSSKLQHHLKSHYQCEVCSEMFSGKHAKRNYERHNKKHQPKEQNVSKSYPCDKCDKSFQFMSYLKRHVEKTHKNTATISLPEDKPVEKSAENSKRKQSLVARKLF